MYESLVADCEDWSASISFGRFIDGADTVARQTSTASAAKAQSCSQTANTQADLSECAGKELQQAEARLAALLKRLGIDANSPEEKAWEAYRDAQLKAIYPPVSR